LFLSQISQLLLLHFDQLLVLSGDVLLLEHVHHLLVLEELHVLLRDSLWLHIGFLHKILLDPVEHLCDLGERILLVELSEGGHVQTHIFWILIGLVHRAFLLLLHLSLVAHLHGTVCHGHLKEVTI
jgi:hypothetical protein